MGPALAVYREFAPCAALRPYIRAIFSFTPGAEDGPSSRRRTSECLAFTGDAICPPLLADGHACVSFTLGAVCHADGRWRVAPAGCTGRIVGAVTHADSSGVERPSMIGAYFRAGGLAAFTSVSAHELTDRAVRVEDVWGPAAASAAVRLAEANEAVRIDVLESLLIGHLGDPRRPRASVDVPALAASIEHSAGHVTVGQAAHAAGISRQHLTRLFRERVGITPKLYARLARFQSGFAYAGSGMTNGGACAAAALGYADQSHWIAEFREFSGLTPGGFAARRWFHPFVERVLRERAGSCAASPSSQGTHKGLYRVQREPSPLDAGVSGEGRKKIGGSGRSRRQARSPAGRLDLSPKP
jgi:AraC-like DNA-binding protein